MELGTHISIPPYAAVRLSIAVRERSITRDTKPHRRGQRPSPRIVVEIPSGAPVTSGSFFMINKSSQLTAAQDVVGAMMVDVVKILFRTSETIKWGTKRTGCQWNLFN
jgi:hypothetical protein